MAAKLIVFLAVVGATYALAASPKFRRDSSSSSSSSSSDSASGSASSSSSAEGSASWSWSSNSSINIEEEVSSVLKGSDRTSVFDLSGLGFLKSSLSEEDFTNVTYVAKIPTLHNVDLLPPILDLKESLQFARKRVLILLNGSASVSVDIQTAIQEATIKALHAPSPVKALSDMCYNILNIYYTLAVNSPFHIATVFVIEEGVQMVTSILTVVAKVVVEIKV